jgi:8-oxo-dGTP pyrophosphatase MutT (NUDIX family)
MLAIFDNDGTICDTQQVEWRCYSQAIERVTGQSLAVTHDARFDKLVAHHCFEENTMKPWTTLRSTEIVTDRWLNLSAESCRLSDGTVLEPYYVIKDPDWVQIFAQTPHGQVLVVRQYRHAARVTCVELPGGAVEKGESPLEAAQRELLEETGHTARDWIEIGRMFSDPARLTNCVHTFLALNAERIAPQSLEHGEELVVEASSIHGIEAMIERREFSSAMHIASFRQVLAHLAREKTANHGTHL